MQWIHLGRLTWNLQITKWLCSMLIFRGVADTHEVQNVFFVLRTHTHHVFFSQRCIRRWGEGSNFHLKKTSITFRVPKLTFQKFPPHENQQKTHKLDFMGWNQMFCIISHMIPDMFFHILEPSHPETKNIPKHSPLEATKNPLESWPCFQPCLSETWKTNQPTNLPPPPKKQGR